MLRRAAWLTSRRAAAALRTHKPSTTHVTADGIDGASVGISLPEETIVPEAVAFRPMTYLNASTVVEVNPATAFGSSSLAVKPILVEPPKTLISTLSIGTNLVGGSSLLGIASSTAFIQSSYASSPIKTLLDVEASLKPLHDDPSSSWRSPSRAMAPLDVKATLELPQATESCWRLTSIEAALAGGSSLLEFGNASSSASVKTSPEVAATLELPQADEASSWCPSSKAMVLLASVGALCAFEEDQPYAACVQPQCPGQPRIPTPCECNQRNLRKQGDVLPVNWDHECRARVTSGQKNSVVVPRYGVASTCKNYINFPHLFLPADVLGGVHTGRRPLSFPAP